MKAFFGFLKIFCINMWAQLVWGNLYRAHYLVLNKCGARALNINGRGQGKVDKGQRREHSDIPLLQHWTACPDTWEKYCGKETLHWVPPGSLTCQIVVGQNHSLTALTETHKAFYFQNFQPLSRIKTRPKSTKFTPCSLKWQTSFKNDCSSLSEDSRAWCSRADI